MFSNPWKEQSTRLFDVSQRLAEPLLVNSWNSYRMGLLGVAAVETAESRQSTGQLNRIENDVKELKTNRKKFIVKHMLRNRWHFFQPSSRGYRDQFKAIFIIALNSSVNSHLKEEFENELSFKFSKPIWQTGHLNESRELENAENKREKWRSEEKRV